MGRLDGKVAIITGAAGGQGAVEAKLFAKEGAKVVITDLNDELLGAIAEEIKSEGGLALPIKHNVTSIEDWHTVVESTMKEFGKVDILVNNAGITGQISQNIEDMDISSWDKIMDINAKGVFLGTKAVISEMKKSGGGSIVNISSLSGIYGIGNPAYNSSKGAVRQLTKNVALDYAGSGIRVNSVHPGTIETPMVEAFVGKGNKEGREAALKGIPLNTLGQSEDVAYGVLYLASDESKFVTGIELIIDGGSILQ
ncbi:SDR family NAD(P)-dependent oxidoreductase [Oceanobacillus sojae]|uniref:SDR family NAD(P)-dependent oxidoreductase n=1 Tax=Oceanobacillus sojae TaxID=582851 RepID=UPI0021A38177|nr:SDR family oxidoreductase [Oceanobacillus sojae]MCT1901586.1 SDR family oxidoreductase [Oceanobacillus sojae]